MYIQYVEQINKMLTREQLSNAAIQSANNEQDCVGHILAFEQLTLEEFIIREKSICLPLSDEIKEQLSTLFLFQKVTLRSWLQIAIQKFQQNAILIDELLIAFDENRLSELSVIPPVPKEYRMILTHFKFKSDTDSIEKACLDAITVGDSETVDILISVASILEPDNKIDVNKLFEHTVNKGDATILTILSQDPRIDPSIKRYFHTDKKDVPLPNDFKKHAIVFSSKMGFVDVVDTLIRHYHVYPSQKDDEGHDLIQIASRYGHLAVVDRLLQEARVDPSAGHNYAILLASDNGHLAVVDRLLQDPRVNPSDANNWAIRCASENGHLAVVDRLLQDMRVDPSAKDNESIRLASRYGHLAVVDRLLQDPRVNPSVDNNYAIIWASVNGHKAVVDRLLQEPWDPRVDPSANNNESICLASRYGHLAVVDRLLQDPRVDPSACKNKAIHLAFENGHHAVVNRLLKDKRIKLPWLLYTQMCASVWFRKA
jgi:ankyrin repeat protein